VWPRPQDKGLQGGTQQKGGGKGAKGKEGPATTTTTPTTPATPTKAQVKKAAAEALEAEAVAQKAKEEKAQAKAKAKQAKADAKAIAAVAATSSASASAPAAAQVMTRAEIQSYMKRISMAQVSKCTVIPEKGIRMKSLCVREADEVNRQVLEQLRETPQTEVAVAPQTVGGVIFPSYGGDTEVSRQKKDGTTLQEGNGVISLSCGVDTEVSYHGMEGTTLNPSMSAIVIGMRLACTFNRLALVDSGATNNMRPGTTSEADRASSVCAGATGRRRWLSPADTDRHSAVRFGNPDNLVAGTVH
jgi:hypothetical protein